MQEPKNLDWNRVLERLGIPTERESAPEPLIRIGVKPEDYPTKEPRFANDEQWDWWKRKIS
jgi:hypothetical protein